MPKPVTVIEHGSSKPTVEPLPRALPTYTLVSVFDQGKVTEIALGSLVKDTKFHFEGRSWKVAG